MSDYGSSEELQRHNLAEVFAKTEAKKAETIAEKDKLKKSIDKYIAEHSSTTAVRALALKNKRSNDYQMDLSADLVEILTNIKKGI
jgi:hypothetical protein